MACLYGVEQPCNECRMCIGRAARSKMTENEAIAELKEEWEHLGKAIPCDTGWGMAINEAYSMAVEALEEIQQYRSIGTVSECREAVEKRKVKKPERKVQGEDLKVGCVTFKAGTKTYWCPSCRQAITGADYHCRYCGQAIEWGE